MKLHMTFMDVGTPKKSWQCTLQRLDDAEILACIQEHATIPDHDIRFEYHNQTCELMHHGQYCGDFSWKVVSD